MCDGPSVMSTAYPRARLPHTCYSCGEMVAVGEEYQVDSGIWDGRADRFRRHLLCAALERQLRGDDGCYLFGCLGDAENILEEPSATFRAAWETAMRRPWSMPSTPWSEPP